MAEMCGIAMKRQNSSPAVIAFLSTFDSFVAFALDSHGTIYTVSMHAKSLCNDSCCDMKAQRRICFMGESVPRTDCKQHPAETRLTRAEYRVVHVFPKCKRVVSKTIC